MAYYDRSFENRPYGRDYYGRDFYGREPYGREDQWGGVSREGGYGNQPWQAREGGYGSSSGSGSGYAGYGYIPGYQGYYAGHQGYSPGGYQAWSPGPQAWGYGYQGSAPGYQGSRQGQQDYGQSMVREGWGSGSAYGQGLSGQGNFYSSQRSGGQQYMPWGQQGQHAGRGPKGYQRSDQRIEEDINEGLTHDPEIDASEVEVKVQHGEATLTGTVDSREAKRRAEDIADHCSGVKDVHNNLKVQHQSQSSSQQGSQSSEGRSRAGRSTAGAGT